MKRRELSIASVVTVYALGLAFVAIGVVAIAYLFRSRARDS
jgi:uncharacterized membrane protein HdeD (DUF308 family)